MVRRNVLRAAASLIVAGLSHTAFGGLVGPSPYTSAADSPFSSVDFTGGYFHLEDFEDLLLNVPGVSQIGGTPIGPGGLTDSVDEDDGVIDGNGTNGRSLFGNGAAGISFVFDATVLGSLPSHAGIVWTDGEGTISFEAFDGDGTSLGTIGPFSEPGVVPDNTFVGGTAEDRFFGFADAPAGISRIFISNTAGGIEVDHLQFGGFGIEPPPPPNAIPLPAGVWAGLAMFAMAGAAYRRANRPAK